MRILCIGDPHIRAEILPRCKLMIQAIISRAAELKPDLIVVLGDTLHTHERMNLVAHATAVDFFKQLARIAPLYILIGNHDRLGNQDFLSNIHPFTALEPPSGGHNIFVSGTVTCTIIEGHLLIFVPYVFPGRFREALSLIPGWEKAKVIFAHQEFRGCNLGVMSSQEGDVWSTTLPTVISGHIHLRHRMSENVYYVGTPIQTNFGEDENKMLSLFTIADQIVETPIQIDVPKLQQFNLTCEEVHRFQIPEGIQAKVKIRGTAAELKTVMKLPKVLTWKREGVKISEDTIPLTTIVDNPGSIRLNLDRREAVPYSKLLFGVVVGTPLEALYRELFQSNF